MDLHTHTPASSDYRDPTVSYLSILQKAEERGLDIIAFTDHNTVRGYATLMAEIERLELLERLNRIMRDERQLLEEYRRLLAKLLVLPGFEFTATFGFHILGIFPPSTPIRTIEHLLLSLNVPADKLDQGSTEVGPTTDVLTAYAAIARAGGLVVAAHANSTHGVAMQGFRFGGQTKVAYTQDPNLHALEVTDLESSSRRSTAAFYNGSKPEYPRRMHCIQGSDCHMLERDPNDKGQVLGLGERVTEVLLPGLSFAALREVFLGDDFTRTRPYKPAQPFDPVRVAQAQGPNLVQCFHEQVASRRGGCVLILRDVVAFANTNGGTIYVGATASPTQTIKGIEKPDEAVKLLESEIRKRISPTPAHSIETLTSDGKSVVQVNVHRGAEKPYVLETGQVFVRHESETNIAMRDEIVQLVLEAEVPEKKPGIKPVPPPLTSASGPPTPVLYREPAVELAADPPRTGVEIVASVEKDGITYHTMKDLRNGSIVHNVTRFSARRLWRYAIMQKEMHTPNLGEVRWQERIGLWKITTRSGEKRYNLVQLDGEDNLHVYYGVTEEGIHGRWKDLIGDERGANGDQGDSEPAEEDHGERAPGGELLGDTPAGLLVAGEGAPVHHEAGGKLSEE